jgi:protein XagA
MRASVLFVLFGALFLCAGEARAGAWLYPEGRGQLILSTTFADARNAYDATGRLVQTPPYRKFETRAYLEHGATDWLTLTAEGSAMRFRGAPPPIDRSEDLNILIEEAKAGAPLIIPRPPRRGVTYEGLGLGSVGARVRLFDYGDYAFSFEGSLRAASSEARRFLDMRDATQIDARLLMGRAFNLFGLPGFVDTQLAYRTRGQNGDEIRLDLTAGVRPFERLMIMAQSFSAIAPRGGPPTLMAAQKLQFSAVVEVAPALSIQIGAVAAPRGANSPAERGLIGAVWWRY